MDTRGHPHDHPRSRTTPTLLDMPELVLSKIMNIVPLVCTDLAMTNRSVCAIKGTSKYLGPYVDVKDVQITRQFSNADATSAEERTRWQNFNAWMVKHGHKLHTLHFAGDRFTSQEILSIMNSPHRAMEHLTHLRMWCSPRVIVLDDVLNVDPAHVLANLLADMVNEYVVVNEIPHSVRIFKGYNVTLSGSLPTGLKALILDRASILGPVRLPDGLKLLDMGSRVGITPSFRFPPSLYKLNLSVPLSVAAWNSLPQTLRKMKLARYSR